MEQAGFRSTWAGIAGDTSANLLYRITHGEFPDRIYPKVVVISIGIVDLVRAANRDLEVQPSLTSPLACTPASLTPSPHETYRNYTAQCIFLTVYLRGRTETTAPGS